MSQSALKNRDFSRIYLASSLSELGSFTTETVLMLYLYTLSGEDKAIMGLERACFLLFFVGGSLLGSPFGEKKDKKKILLWTEIVRIPLTLALLLFNNVYAIIVLHGFIAFFSGVFKPVKQAYINQKVESELLSSANSLVSTSFAFIHVIAPVIGAGLYQLQHSLLPIIALDLLTYALGIILLMRVSGTLDLSKKIEKVSVYQDLKEGLNKILATSNLRELYIYQMITGITVGIIMPLLLPYCVEVLGQDKTFYGQIMSAFGVGGLIGGLMSKNYNNKYAPSQTIALFTGLEALLLAVWLQFRTPYLSLGLLLIWGAIVFIKMPAIYLYLAKQYPPEFQTRLNSVLEIAFIFPNVLSGLIIVLVGKKFATIEILQVTAIFAVGVNCLRPLFNTNRKFIKSSL